MKHKFFAVACFAIVILISSCSNSVERDAKEAAVVACKLQHIISTTSFQESMDERIELEAEAKKMELELKQKYPTKQAWKQFMQAYYKELNNCAASYISKK